MGTADRGSFHLLSLIVLVFVETQDLATSLSSVLERAAEEALGPGASVAVYPIQAGTPDAVLAGLGQARGAWAVARVAWGGAQLDASLEVSLIRSGRRLIQPLAFLRSDPMTERWRALGLVLASTLTKDAAAHGDVPRPRGLPDETVAAPASEPAPAPRWALDAAAEAGFAMGGSDIGNGGTIGLRWLRFPHVAFRLGFRARFGEVNEAQATMTALAGTAGLVFDVLRRHPESRLGLSARVEAMFLDEILSHLSADDAAPVRKARFLPGASVLAEARWALSPALAVTVAAGPELALGATNIYVRNTQVAHLSPLRGVLQVGLAASF